MKKIICEVCGTTYPDTAAQCPICGYTGNPVEQPDAAEGHASHYTGGSKRVKGGKFSQSNVRKRNQQSGSRPAYRQEEPEEYYEQEEERSDSNPFLVALLVVVITALLVVTAVIFFRYYLPNSLPQETLPPTEPSTLSTEESTDPTVPCTALAITDGAVRVELKQAGDKHLLNVKTIPEDTTDELLYVSSDETVATVNGEGRVTAVGPGEAVITISCGDQSTTCTVICDFETEPDPSDTPDA